MKRTSLAVIAALVASASHAAAQTQQISRQTEADGVRTPTGTMVIENLDAVWTAAGPVQRNVSIVIRDGIIREIGANISRPAGAQVIDGRGHTAMPGVVDEHSHIAMGGGTNEGTAPVVPEVRVLDRLDVGDFGIYQALSGGVTTAQLLHGSANPIGGQSALIKLRWGMTDPYQLLMKGAPRYVKFALGENVTRKGATANDRFPASREGVEAIFEQAFTAAQEYRKAWQDYNRNPSSFRVPPRRDLRLEALVDIMEGRIRVHAHSYRSDEILMLIRVADRFGFKIDAFTHVLEGYRVAEELKQHGAGASTFSDWWGYKLEVANGIPYNPAILQKAGVLTSLNSDIPWLQSFLLYEMQKPVKYGGVSKEDALRMMTINPAKQLKIDDKVGSLEVGKAGDVVLLNGDPFNTFSRVEKTIVDGIVYYDRATEAQMRREPVRRIASIPEAAAVILGLPSIPVNLAFEPPMAPAEQKLTDPIDTSPVTVITGATVHPVSRAPVPNGVVVIENGVIKAVGTAAEVQIPANARRVDASGKHVYPGMIDPLTSIGLVDIESVPSARDDREVGSFNPHLRALFGVNMFTDHVPIARANGVTSALTIPASGIVRGAGSLIQMKGDTPEKANIADRAALVVQFPSPTGQAWEAPGLAGDNIQNLIALFRRATQYAANPTSLRDPTTRFEVNVDPNDRVLFDAMLPAVRGEQPVIFIAQSERNIKSLLMFLDTFPAVKAVIGGGNQAYHVADELAKRNIPVIIGSSLTPNDYRDDPVTAPWRLASILREKGVKISFTTSFSPEGVSEIRNLPYAAARSVSFGLSEADAIRGLTLSAAEMLGMQDKLGSLDVGKRADLIITDGSPLQILTHVERMWIGGDEMPLASHHTQLYWQFRNRSKPITTF